MLLTTLSLSLSFSLSLRQPPPPLPLFFCSCCYSCSASLPRTQPLENPRFQGLLSHTHSLSIALSCVPLLSPARPFLCAKTTKTPRNQAAKWPSNPSIHQQKTTNKTLLLSADSDQNLPLGSQPATTRCLGPAPHLASALKATTHPTTIPSDFRCTLFHRSIHQIKSLGL